MKRFILTLLCVMAVISTAIAQDGKIVQGVVFDANSTPIPDATIVAVGGTETAKSDRDGKFTITVSPYVRQIKVIAAGFISPTLDVDGSYLMFKLKVDRSYYESKAKAADEAARKEEAERLAQEKAAAAKAKAEEQARIDAAKKAEAERLAQERAAAAKAKAEEQARIDAIKKADADNRRKLYAEEQKGFGSIVDISYMLSYYPSFGANYTAGYCFNNQIYLGLGAGISFNLNGGKAVRSAAHPHNNSVYNSDINGDILNPSLISVPVFAYFKANFINRRCSPFFALAAGANLSAKQTLLLDLCDVQYSTMGAFANPQLGVNFRTTKKTSIYLAAGFQFYVVPSCIKYTSYNAVLRSSLGYGVDFHFGFTF